MTKAELLENGYRLWSDGLPLYLIPLVRKDYHAEDEVVTCISGFKVLVKDTDLDTRAGLLAYGVYPSDC